MHQGSTGSEKDTMPDRPVECFLIGVGASAGGLEPIYNLFERPTPPNTSFIIIQHLPPGFKSNTATLLANHIQREVKEISNHLLIEPDTIYVIAERKNILIKEGRFVTKEDLGIQPNNAVDILLKSLAEYKGSKSGAIILSGANDDGTKGAEAIKAAGGFVVAQEPSTAQFNIMPGSVISSGVSDSIAPPEHIMDEVRGYIKQSELLNQFTDDNEAALLEILDIISTNTPLDFGDYKRTTIVRRIARRMAFHNFIRIHDYINYLQKNHDEIEILTKEFMISVTKFFRDANAFEVLQEKVFPELISQKKQGEALKAWVVGCATGEEAYSLAILLREHLEKINKSIEVKIFASDIDQKALAVASKGIYPESISENISPERLSNYFYKEEGFYRIKEEIRSMLIFSSHDITKHPPYYKLDFISCRNVLIYLNPLLQTKILSKLHFCLNLDGYLFLGPSESPGDLKNKIEEIDKKWKIYKNLEAGTNLENFNYLAPKQYLNVFTHSRPSLKTSKSENRNNMEKIVNEILIEELGCAGVCVDENFKITQTYGDYGKYLLPEMFNFQILELLPKELSIATGISLRKALKENKDISVSSVAFQEEEKWRSVNVRIKVLPGKSSEKKLLVLFSEDKSVEVTIQNTEVFDKETHSHRYIADLEEEVKDLKEKLKESYEELELCNTNAQSVNEELVSGNEELQSTNEEVQSVNEELQTVNNQYQIKIKELAELNDDLNNYFRSAQNAQIYIDKDLIIRKFTPPAIKQINVRESDIGRPITDISTKIKFSTFLEDIKMCASSYSTIEKEIQVNDGRWYQMIIMPYIKYKDNSGNGIIITFNDVTELKKSQISLMNINEDHNTFIYSVSHDLNSPVSNISGLIDALDAFIDPNDKKLKDLTGLVSISINKLKEIIAELADIPKIEKESSEDLKEFININTLLDDIKLSIKDLLIRSDVKIDLDLKETEIRFSKKNLRSILLNLLTNAIKYRSPERKLEISIRTESIGNYTNLYVQDNGLGINSEKKSKLFSKFHRAHEESGVSGSGIGLYLIKKILANAEGKIRVESEEGKGSTFIVSFKN